MLLSSKAGCPHSFIHFECNTCCAVALSFGRKTSIDWSISLNALLSISVTVSRPASALGSCIQYPNLFSQVLRSQSRPLGNRSPSSLNHSILLLHFAHHSGGKTLRTSTCSAVTRSAFGKKASNKGRWPIISQIVQASVQISEANESGSSENLASGGWRRGRVFEENLGVLCGLKDSPKSLRIIFSSPKAIPSLRTPNQPGGNTCVGTPFGKGLPSRRTTASGSGSPNLSCSSDVE